MLKKIASLMLVFAMLICVAPIDAFSYIVSTTNFDYCPECGAEGASLILYVYDCTKPGPYYLYCDSCCPDGLIYGHGAGMLDKHEDEYVVEIVRKEATCTEDGYVDTYLACRKCEQYGWGFSEYTLPATGHTYGKGNKCTVCGVKKGSSTTATPAKPEKPHKPKKNK